MTVDLEALEQAAKAASAGPWAWSPSGDALCAAADQLVLWSSSNTDEEFDENFETTVTASISDRAHIAGADPSTVLALIARIRELETALTAAADAIDHGRTIVSVQADFIRALVEKGSTR